MDPADCHPRPCHWDMSGYCAVVHHLRDPGVCVHALSQPRTAKGRTGCFSLGLLLLAVFGWMAGYTGLSFRAAIMPRFTRAIALNLGFPVIEGAAYIFPALLAASVLVYGNWKRVRYFGTTAPLITSFAIVLLFAMVPAIHL